MAEPVRMKCKYYNSGYCKFSRSQQGCKQFHPKETCQQYNCKDKCCPLRHPKKCRYKENCRYQTRCSYSHKQTPDNRDEVSNINEDIKVLKVEIANLKNENGKKINILVKVHLKHLAAEKAVSDLKIEVLESELKILKAENNKEIAKVRQELQEIKLVSKNEMKSKGNKQVENKTFIVEKKNKCVDEEPELKVFKCKLCDFKDKHEVRSHYLIKHCNTNDKLPDDTKNTCKVCGKSFNIASIMTDKFEKHLDNNCKEY